MSGGRTGRLREVLSQRRVQLLVALVGVLLAAAVIVPRLPRPIAGAAMLDQCLWGWPVLVFEGEDWRAALPISIPDEYRAFASRYIPVASWPDGMRFDETIGALLDAQGNIVFRKGDRVRIKGSVIDVHGDPAPCYYRPGVQVAEIAPL